jgi:hypothetical protein
MSAAAGAAAAAAAIARAIKASGAIVRRIPDQCLSRVDRNDEALVVHSPGGVLRSQHRYLTGYRGFVFFTKSSEPLALPADCEIIEARRIWIPN